VTAVHVEQSLELLLIQSGEVFALFNSSVLPEAALNVRALALSLARVAPFTILIANVVAKLVLVLDLVLSWHIRVDGVTVRKHILILFVFELDRAFFDLFKKVEQSFGLGLGACNLLRAVGHDFAEVSELHQ
jgi:hypothetical protein